MILSLIMGIVLGASSVLFALQNVADVTVSFLGWQLTEPLAFILLGALFCGVIITLLVLLPRLISDDAYLKSVLRQKREVEDELAKYRAVSSATPRGSEAEPEGQRILAS